MNKNINQYSLVIIVLFILIIGWFYWYECRPTSIRKECYKYAEMMRANYEERVKQKPARPTKKYVWNSDDSQPNYYRECLMREGILPVSKKPY